MTGYDLARNLRDLDPGIGLIALTGYGQPADVRSAIDAGFHSHWTKPVEISALLAALAAIPARRPAVSP